MTHGLDTAPNLTDSFVQSRIAQALQHYNRIDLTIPAQRLTANEVRMSLGLNPLAPLGDIAINSGEWGGTVIAPKHYEEIGFD